MSARTRDIPQRLAEIAAGGSRQSRGRRAGSALRRTGKLAHPSAYRRGIFFSVGIDIVSVAEVAASLERFGERYVRRVFTSHEAAYALAGAERVAAGRLAARFAAKEAAVKALQPERPWANWRAIEVRRSTSGRCGLVLHGEAAVLAARRGIRQMALSMSHDGDRAAAVVIALRAPHVLLRPTGERRHD